MAAEIATGAPKPASDSSSAPNATGAVLASNETIAALNGFMPAASSMAAEIATGAPKPASDSSSAPKQKAIRIGNTP